MASRSRPGGWPPGSDAGKCLPQARHRGVGGLGERQGFAGTWLWSPCQSVSPVSHRLPGSRLCRAGCCSFCVPCDCERLWKWVGISAPRFTTSVRLGSVRRPGSVPARGARCPTRRVHGPAVAPLNVPIPAPSSSPLAPTGRWPPSRTFRTTLIGAAHLPGSLGEARE